MTDDAPRRRSIGAEPIGDGVHFRVWAPSRKRVAVVIDGRDHPLERETGGHFSGFVAGARAGTRYRLRLDDEGETYPDPASRSQPDGPHGESEVVDPHAYRWQTEWRGVDTKGLIVSEIHIGTFTPAGTFVAAIEKLPLLAEVEINLIEVMPISEFPGRFGWGYDGVDLFAPAHIYGSPDDFRRLIDAAHANGIGVILDVVYNHFGPDGCYLRQFAPHYFTERHTNDWGESVNFDGNGSEGVREICIENAAYWIDEFRLDGLRLDATQDIHDNSEEHILKVIADSARAAAGDRTIFIVAENEGQNTMLIRDYGLDAMWNDDWHHAALIALGRKPEAYYSDYRGHPQEFVSMAKRGFLYQGQWYSWQKKNRGTPTAGIEAHRFVQYLENHDQLANSANGARVHRLAPPGRHRAMTALLLLSPQTPLLFQGEEFGSSKPFLYFADHKPELAEAVRKGRGEFLSQFPSIAAIVDQLAPPESVETFERSKLNWSERKTHSEALALHRDLIALRRGDPTFSAQRNDILDGAVLGEHAFLLRWLTDSEADRLLIVNLGAALHLDPAPEPLLAPPLGMSWTLLWSSESPQYGGEGTPTVEGEEGWRIPAESAVVMRASS
jgi:maltooligosyltrehalose trehalohydrolase